jgi:hypothetical protein
VGKIEQAAARGIISSAVSQGVAVATGLQSSFDWAGVAVAGIGAAARTALGPSLGKIGTAIAGGSGFGAVVATRLLGGVADTLVQASSRSLITGTDFGDNVRAALPGIIGNTIGSLVGDGISSRSSASSRTPITQITAADGPIVTSPTPDLATLVGPIDLGGGAPLSSQDAKTMETSATNASQTAAVADRAGGATGGAATGNSQQDNGANDTIVVTASSKPKLWSEIGGFQTGNGAFSVTFTQAMLGSHTKSSQRNQLIVGFEAGHAGGGQPGSGIVARTVKDNLLQELNDGKSIDEILTCH